MLDYLPDRDKIARVHAATPIMEAGRLWIPRHKDWAEDLFAEAIQFPYGKHDDQVDAMTMAIHYLKDSWHLTHPDDLMAVVAVIVKLPRKCISPRP